MSTRLERGLGAEDVDRLVASLCANPATLHRLASILCPRSSAMSRRPRSSVSWRSDFIRQMQISARRFESSLVHTNSRRRRPRSSGHTRSRSRRSGRSAPTRTEVGDFRLRFEYSASSRSRGRHPTVSPEALRVGKPCCQRDGHLRTTSLQVESKARGSSRTRWAT